MFCCTEVRQRDQTDVMMMLFVNQVNYMTLQSVRVTPRTVTLPLPTVTSRCCHFITSAARSTRCIRNHYPIHTQVIVNVPSFRIVMVIFLDLATEAVLLPVDYMLWSISTTQPMSSNEKCLLARWWLEHLFEVWLK